MDKSLLVGPTADQTRFSELQTLWQYGRDRLDESGEADTIRARHAVYYRQFAEGANERLRGAAAPVWRARLTPELANMKVAADWTWTPATLMRRCRWSLEWRGCGSSTAILPKVRVGWPARQVPREAWC